MLSQAKKLLIDMERLIHYSHMTAIYWFNFQSALDENLKLLDQQKVFLDLFIYG
jgi:hypothetical protein